MRLRTSDLISAAPKSGPHLCAVLPYNDWFIINSLKEIIVFVVQVNQWLTWLETAEEEESEGEDYWGTGQSHVLSGCNERFFFFFFLNLLCVCACPHMPSPPLIPTASLLSCLYIFSNHCYNLFHYEMFRQIKPASPPSTCIYAFIDFKILFDVLQQKFNTTSWVMWTVGSIVQETVPAPKTWPILSPLASGRSHQVLQYWLKNCLQNRTE